MSQRHLPLVVAAMGVLLFFPSCTSTPVHQIDAEQIARRALQRRGYLLPGGGVAEISRGNTITDFQPPQPTIVVLFWSQAGNHRRHLYTVTLDASSGKVTGIVDVSHS